ncbi:hypothetical protein O181_017220 [Austropuccinia psidii MF-1]|uniref:(2E,6E)-farnesyl diphosphate synthase n=1 Tax=Austropuccinia psidii MF-1 TaxID=1389203 RepID=A0A9Q3GST1_9BASI|nr:hypothetical protein [Austropuccinia psidii MF-1]
MTSSNQITQHSQNHSIQHSYGNFLEKIRTAQPQWSDQKEKIVLEPYTYLTATPGKEIRSLMIDAFNHWLSVPADQLEVVKRIVGQLHTSSLLMDDVEDGSELRRGIPVAHKIYGIPQTINSANYVYFLSYQELLKLQPPNSSTVKNLWHLVNEELLRLHRGQGMELYWRDSLTCPTEDEYIEMVTNKTGGLFRIGIKLMMAMSPLIDIPNYLPLVDLFSVYFQIRDDLLNISSVYTKNKGFCEDLTEGKFSFPVVHAIRADTTNHQILNVLRQRSHDDATKAYAVAYMKEKTKSLAYTRSVLHVLEGQAVQEIKRLGDNPLMQKIVEMMAVGPSPPPSEG